MTGTVTPIRDDFFQNGGKRFGLPVVDLAAREVCEQNLLVDDELCVTLYLFDLEGSQAFNVGKSVSVAVGCQVVLEQPLCCLYKVGERR